MKLQKAESIDKIAGIVNRFSIRGAVSNNYLLPSELHTEVTDGRLFYCHSDSNLYLFLRKPGDFLRLYYILNDLNERPSFKMDMPLMTEILFRGNVGLPEKELAFLQEIGFAVNLRRDQYSASASEIEGLTPAYVPSIEAAQEAVDLFNSSFDKFSGDFIPADTIRSLYEEKRILCVVKENGELGGALEISIQGKNAWISHLAVKPDSRRQGVADKLIKMYAQAAIERGASRLMLWVQSQNTAAISLYAKYGFRYTNKSTISLIKL